MSPRPRTGDVTAIPDTDDPSLQQHEPVQEPQHEPMVQQHEPVQESQHEPMEQQQDERALTKAQLTTSRTSDSAVAAINAVKADTDRILQILEKPKRGINPAAHSQAVQQRAQALQAARSIAGMLSSSGDILESVPKDGLLICSVCHSENKRSGAFQYDFAVCSTFVGSQSFKAVSPA